MEEARFGALEITPIYEVKDYENQALLFQSDEWRDALEHSLNEGKRQPGALRFSGNNPGFAAGRIYQSAGWLGQVA